MAHCSSPTRPGRREVRVQDDVSRDGRRVLSHVLRGCGMRAAIRRSGGEHALISAGHDGAASELLPGVPPQRPRRRGCGEGAQEVPLRSYPATADGDNVLNAGARIDWELASLLDA